ncbi:MAG: hypothetical protein WCF54_14935, partial [Terracidiphilus sp.]
CHHREAVANLLFLFKIFSSLASSSSEELQNVREFLWGFYGSAPHQNGKNSNVYKHFILYQLTILNDHQLRFIAAVLNEPIQEQSDVVLP